MQFKINLVILRHIKLFKYTQYDYIIGSISVCCIFFYFKNDVEIPIPKFFINERYDVLKEREKLLGKILAKIGPQEKEDVSILF